MALLVYVTEACRQETKNHGLQDVLEKVKIQLETDQDTRRLEAFPNPYWMKKQFGRRQGRLVIVERNIELEGETHQVFVFLALIQRGDKSYDELSYNIVLHGERYLYDRLKNVDLVAYAQERLSQHDVVEKVKPSDTELAYLYSIHQDEQNDETIYESTDWFNSLQQAEFKQLATRIFDSLGKVIDATSLGGVWLSVERCAGHAFLARYFPISGFWFLAGIISEDNADIKQALAYKYQAVLTAEDNKSQSLYMIVLQHARKAYPALLSAEESIWKNLEFDSVGNLALSPEESEVLSSAKDIQSPFPLFINGRAGSGKSTVLQYLFADYLYYYLSHKDHAAVPAYFSCSSELIKRASEVVASLLECGGKYWQDSHRQHIVKDNRYYFDKAFMEFRRFLHNHVPEHQQELLALRNHIDYARFRQYWERHFKHDPLAKTKYPADVSWHVIRSYIKGSNSELFLEPEDYQSIEQKQQSVTFDTFKLVYEKVWEWYKELCNRDKLWDDQDLARLVLKEDLVRPQFPAIFCDESQDFTRLELEVILRLSLFSDKKIAPHEIRRIPFVFAGDQFQTLNPTGFRWEATKAQFVEKFIFALDNNNVTRNTEMNYKELSHNFRSAPPIVRFSNIIQGLRALLFKLNSLQPQIPWSLENNTSFNAVMRFDIHQPEVWRTLKTFKDIVFVVPCLENEETDYIKNNPFLRNHIRIEEDGSTSIPVLSASRAKGLEFNRVVVVGFGSDSPKALDEILLQYKNNADEMESDLSLQYFLNRLYVAVTRAKRQLIILDSTEGMQRFWHYFSDPVASLQLQNLRQAPETWLKHLGHLAELPLSALTINPENEGNAAENAAEFERNGRENKDAYLLRQAGSLYRQIEQEIDSWLCFAEAEEIDKQYLKAGKLYAQAGQYQHAFQCYWRGKEWSRLLDLGSEHPNFRGRLEYRFTEQYRTKHRKDEAVVDVFYALAKNIKQIILAEDEDIHAWYFICDNLLTQLIKSKTAQHLNWHDLSSNLHIIYQERLFQRILQTYHRAEIAFRAKNYQEARQLWESTSDNKPNNYYIAVAETTPFPHNINALQRLKRWDTLLEQYENFQAKDNLKLEHWTVIAKTLVEKSRYDALLEILVHLKKDEERLHEIRRAAQKSRHTELVVRCRSAEIIQLVITEQWQDILKLLHDKQEKQHELLLKVVMRGLARSEAYTKLSSQEQDNVGRSIRDQLSDLIRKQYLGTKDDKKPIYQVPENLIYEVGSALERTRRYVDGLSYYEAMMQRFPAQEQALALRWLACKERQVRHYEAIYKKTDNPDEREQHKKLAEDNNMRAIKMRHKLDLSSTDIIDEWPRLSELDELVSEFLQGKDRAQMAASLTAIQDTTTTNTPEDNQQKPILDEISPFAQDVEDNAVVAALPTDNTPIVAPINDAPPAKQQLTSSPIKRQAVAHKLPEKVEFMFGDFKISVTRKTQRINIELTETGDSIAIKQGGQDIASDWPINIKEDGCIYVEGTPLWINHQAYHQENRISLGHDSLGLIINIDLSKTNVL